MSITLNGTTGLAGANGSASTPAVQGEDANTGIFFPAADTIAFAEGGAEVARFDSSGNLGVGTTSPSYALSVARNTSSELAIQAVNAGIGNTGIRLQNSLRHWSLFVNDGDSGPLRFYDYTAAAERARITAGGFLLSGTTSDLGGQFNSLGTGRDAIVTQVTSNSNSPYLGKNSAGSVIFIVSGLGTIYAVNTTVQSTSDVRTKENIRDSTDGLQVVMGLRPRRFDFKAGFGGDRKDVLGFVAQEIEQVFPDAVDLMPSGSMPDDPEEPYKSVGPGALIPVLVKAVQEQQALITALTARVAQLEAN